MSLLLGLTCACGEVGWTVQETSPRAGIRYICHCDDCQAFAEFLGRADTVLDANGGIHAYQLPASQVRFTKGRQRLVCVQVTRRPLLRWYCKDCRTPVAGTYHRSSWSFISLSLPLGPDPIRDEVLGPSSGHVWTKYARGELSGARRVNIPAMLWRMLSRIIVARLSGDYRNNPFFDADGAPISSPRRLTPSERAELDRRVQASGA